MRVELEESWMKVLQQEFEKDYMKKLLNFLEKEQQEGHLVYPPKPLIFNSFQHTPFNKTKVVILGQDPYHGVNQAHGLSFSVQKGVPQPPSLKNIFKELQNEFEDFQYPPHGDLTQWADQGVLLLNTTLTVQAKKAGSHQKLGWEKFTDRVIEVISQKKSGIIFLLWGKHAQAKAAFIDQKKHYVLAAAHPSPFSAYNGFFGCDHFKKTNKILIQNGEHAIDWQIK